MNIRQLEAFRAMMRAGTTTGAAALLGLSQPAVSRLLDALERDLALPLFHRTRNRLTPTPEATLLHTEVERTFSSVERIRELAADIRAGDAGTLAIAVLPALAFGLLPPVLAAFKTRHPRTAVAVSIQTSARIEEWAGAQQIDFGLAEQPFSRPGITVEPFCRAALALAVPLDHPLACRAQVTPRDLGTVDLIALPRTSACRRQLDETCHAAGVAPRPVLEAQYTALVAILVAQGLGVGLIDPFTAAAFASRGLTTVPFQPTIALEIAVLHPSQRPLSRAAREFLALLRRHRSLIRAPGADQGRESTA